MVACVAVCYVCGMRVGTQEIVCRVEEEEKMTKGKGNIEMGELLRLVGWGVRGCVG